MNQKHKKILETALKKWGDSLQSLIAIEEMSELTKELVKNERGFDNADSIIEEVADVQIMIWQLMLIYPRSLIEKSIESKMSRLELRLNK